MAGRVTVVDDDDFVRELIQTILEERGYTVSCYPSIASAREGLADAAPDLLIVDVQLGDGCGLDLVGNVRNATGRKVPAIVLSGLRDERDFVRGFAAGAVDYLAKPFVKDELLARCAVHLARTSTFEPSNQLESDLPEKDGLVFGRYRIQRELGRGGYGKVYLATDAERDGAPCALKVLAPLAGEQSDARMRFIRETYALASVEDPHVVKVFDVGAVQGRLYYAMEFVAGEDLWARALRKGSLDEEEARSVLRGLLGALVSLERAGILHRDLKPENILLRGGKLDEPVLVDFGLARRRVDRGITDPDVLIGTIAYIPPEVIRGRAPDRRSDLFSLAMSIRNALDGEEVFPRLQGVELLTEIARGPIPLPAVGLSAGFARLLDRLLRVNPEERFETAAEALTALDAIADAPCHERSKGSGSNDSLTERYAETS